MPKKRTITVFLIVSLFIISFFAQRIESGTIEEQPQILSPQSKEDLQITLTTNVTTIGKQGGALANLTLNNTGINPCGDIEVDFSLDDDYLNFTSKYPKHQEISLLNIDSSTTLNVELTVNESKIPNNPNSADVCLIIDGSWSMVEEIESVKAEIQDLIIELQENITDLRMGVIVHGWKEYSEYPSNDSRNYLEFTDNAQTVSDFVDTLYADGGVEPWGDALAFIDGWDWRNVAKMVIMMGDEDCDPGILVGVGETGGYYNGTELVDAVEALKSRGAIINTIRCGNAGDAVFVNQYTWVAEYTGGESVDLNDAITSGFPGGIPDLIEHWTLELEREYYMTLSANVTWTELDTITNPIHEAQTTILLTLDIAPPSIIVSTYVDPIDFNDFTLEIYATVKDKSNISHANIYWTDDDIEGSPTWHFNMMTLVGDIYYFSLNHLIAFQNVSFYIQASDILSNIAVTEIFNKTITISGGHDVGETLSFLLFTDNSTKNFYFNISIYSTGYIWMNLSQALNVNFTSNSNFLFEEVFTDEYDRMFKITKLGTIEIFGLSLTGNTSFSSNYLYWNIMFPLTQESLRYTYIDLNANRQHFLLSVTLSDPSSGYISMIMDSYNMIAYAYVFDGDWDYVGRVSPSSAVHVSAGTYHIWVIKDLRDGYLHLIYDEKAYTDTDPYYAAGFESIPLIVGLTLIFGFLAIRRKFKKNTLKK